MEHCDMNAMHCLKTIVFTFVFCATAIGQTVEIGERTIPLSFSDTAIGSFDTNRVARELTAFFRIADTPETLFRSDMSPPGELMPLRPVCPLVPPVVIADEIRYNPPPDEQVVIGTNALAALLTAIEQATPYSNTWAQAEALLSDLASGAITNNPAQLREAFVLPGGQLIDSSEWDEKLVRSVTVGWMTRQVFPLSLLDWRTDRWTEDGPLLSVMTVKFLDADFPTTGITDDAICFQDDRWRTVFW
jgi:hypothetical protein